MGDPRVLPDRHGYWQARTKFGNEIVLRVIGGGGFPAVYIDLRGKQHPPEDFNGEWIAPVPSREAVEALVQAATRVVEADDKAREQLESIGLDDVGDQSLTEGLRNAISGLTGKGGV